MCLKLLCHPPACPPSVYWSRFFDNFPGLSNIVGWELTSRIANEHTTQHSLAGLQSVALAAGRNFATDKAIKMPIMHEHINNISKKVSWKSQRFFLFFAPLRHDSCLLGNENEAYLQWPCFVRTACTEVTVNMIQFTELAVFGVYCGYSRWECSVVWSVNCAVYRVVYSVQCRV